MVKPHPATTQRPSRTAPSPKAGAFVVVIWVLTGYGVLLVVGLIASFARLLPVTAEARSLGVPATDLIFFSSTRYSHLFLPDARLTLYPLEIARQRADLERLRVLFPAPADREKVLAWGRRLVAGCRSKHEIALQIASAAGAARYGKQLAPLMEAPITDDLAAHAAWQRLTCAPGITPADLAAAEHIVRAAVPDPPTLSNLLAWGRARRGQKQATRQVPGTRYSFTARPAPPDLDWFTWWIVLEDWCASESVFQARKAELLARFDGDRKFGRYTWDAFLAFGRAALNDRKQAGEADLPPDDERSYLVAALDRLCGQEPGRSRKLEDAAARHFPPTLLRNSQAVWDIVPETGDGFLALNDDLLHLGLNAGWRNVEPYRLLGAPASATGLGRAPLTGAMFVFGLGVFGLSGFAAFLGVRLLTVTFPGILLGLGEDERYRSFREAQHVQFVKHLLITGAVIAASFAVTWATLDPLTVVWSQGPGALFLAVVASLLISGPFMEGIKNLLTVGLIRVGLDPLQSWADDLIAMAAQTCVLWYFQNSLIAIGSGIVIGLFTPMFIEKLHRAIERS